MTPVPVLEPAGSTTAIPGEEPLYEVIDGQRVELPPMGIYQRDIASNLGIRLGVFAQREQRGRVEIEVMFALPVVGRQRRPDVAFVSYDRWPRTRPLPRGEAWPVAPDLAVEIISPTDLVADLLLKVQEYFRAGVQQVWILWPEIKQVYVYESPTQIRVLTVADRLEGNPMLPGIDLPIAGLFEEAVEEAVNGNSGG